MNLIAIVDNNVQIIENMWGDPNRWDDWQRRIFKLDLTILDNHRVEGYNLKVLDLYEPAVNPGKGSIEKKGLIPYGITTDSIILIKGPLYRADTFAFLEFVLGDIEESAYAVPFQGYSSAKTIDLTYYEGGVKKDRRRNLPALSLKTARHAIGYLPDNPVSLLDSHRSPPAGLPLLRDLEEKGSSFVRQKYFHPGQDME